MSQRVPRVLGPTDGETFTIVNITVTAKVVTDDSAGAFVLMEQSVPPGAGTPRHICHREDKTIYVMAGAFTIDVGSESVTAASGTCVIIPRGTVHRFTCIGPFGGTLLVMLSPAGHERFLAQLSALIAREAEQVEFDALYQTYGIELIAEAQASV